MLPRAIVRNCAAIRLCCIGATIFLAGLLAGCQGGVLDPQGPVGAAQRTILLNSVAIMLAIVIPTIVATLGFAWWFRETNTRARFLPDWAYSGRIELVVWSIPILVILFLSGIIWIGSHDLDPMKPLDSQQKPLEVQVVSLDWKWLFIYPEQNVASINQLVVPAGRPVHFSLTSASVMNAFFVPQLGGMIYTMNGMTTQLHLQADQQGKFYGRSAHFSGDGFPGMQFVLHAVAADAFDAFVNSARSQGQALDKTSYQELARQSMDVPSSTYGSVEPDLFHEIATQGVPPAPGPQAGRPEPSASPKAGG
ncbi:MULTISPECIES: ubiquinol oxidase subunit II [unclassified Mesorhizobium]|uniref:ubiquinol oxidase subunit II n=1 Tax=unclassified Mesorhizobium TaxID=325217 RepID=UPI0033361203